MHLETRLDKHPDPQCMCPPCPHISNNMPLNQCKPSPQKRTLSLFFPTIFPPDFIGEEEKKCLSFVFSPTLMAFAHQRVHQNTSILIISIIIPHGIHWPSIPTTKVCHALTQPWKPPASSLSA
jgi:hypothetical protein